MQLIMESLQYETTPEIIWQSAFNLLNRCVSQCDAMLNIFSRNTYLLTSERFEEIAERHQYLKAHYKTIEKQLENKLTVNDVARQFSSIQYEEEKKAKKPKLMKYMASSNDDEYSNEIAMALEISS